MSFPNDSRGKKLLVAAVWLLDVLHLVLVADSVYHYLITEWGNVPALLYSTEELVIIRLATIISQCFFLQRLSNHPRSGYFVPLVTSFGNFTPETVAIFSIGVGVDLLMALMLVYYIQEGKSGFEKTNSLISRLIQYTVATGLATSLVAIACLIAMHCGLYVDTYIVVSCSTYLCAMANGTSVNQNLPLKPWGNKAMDSEISRNQTAMRVGLDKNSVPLGNFHSNGKVDPESQIVGDDLSA
ncbi:hypothetical protein GYMLUDRAFT_59094 [Collybiopsis luxurians FD-317 M1]|uniref:DUF6534 domain-containing protein n=1 Tax=Collybiopsis luxurians FD-317 M1 TaxID=944289 RepID=A0A0D0BBN7_9AGAR|nr:hypothetical protein GYMLUDRAFT_59094 [Collybiopsis luxurians FD-317 M1]